MSRAFVSESDSSFQEPDIPPIKIPLPPGARNYMTPEGAERLRSQLSELSGAERPRISGQLHRMLAGGAGLDRERLGELRRRLREIDRRIEYLTAMLSRTEVIDARRQPGDRVRFGTLVTVEEPDGSQRAYRIVGIDESAPEEGRISWISPLAKALLGRKIADQVFLRLPEGEARLRILKIDP